MDPLARSMLLDMDAEDLVELIETLEDDLRRERRIPNPRLEAEYGDCDKAELARRLDIAETVRRHWRLLARGAAYGVFRLDYLNAVAFREIYGDVPTKEELDRIEAHLDRVHSREVSDQTLMDLITPPNTKTEVSDE